MNHQIRKAEELVDKFDNTISECQQAIMDIAQIFRNAADEIARDLERNEAIARERDTVVSTNDQSQ